MLEHRVDVVAPRVVVEQAVDGEFEFVVEPVEHASHAARWLATAMRQQAGMFFPKLIFIKSSPNRIFLDVQNKLCFTRFKLNDIGFND